MLRADPERSTPVRSGREIWTDHGILIAALALLLFGFGSVIAGNDWWITTLLVALLLSLTCAVLRGLGVRWVAPIALLVELVALAGIFVPGTLVVIVPTPESLRALGSLVANAQDIIAVEQAPVAASAPIVFVIAGVYGLIVIVADAFLQLKRAAPLVGVLLLATFGTPALISGDTPSGWLFIAVAALWLILLRSRTQGLAQTGRRAGPALVLGSGALAAAVLFPLVSPDISAVASSWGKPPPQVFGRGINPMLELGQNLRRDGSVTSLTYTTTLESPPYLKVATLRSFTGQTWRPTTGESGGAVEGEVSVDSDIETQQGSTTISIRGLRSSLLPVPYPALPAVTGLKGNWQLSRVGLTLTSRDSSSEGQKYTVESLDIQPTAEQMRDLTTFVGADLDPYVRLPEIMPAIIAETAEQVTRGADNDYDRVLALQKYFRDGDFRYSEEAPVAEGYDGNGVDVISRFLQVKAGYCVHFSSAMAVMARTLGIPSRIAVGYAPGASTGIKDGVTTYEVNSDDLHAWTEIYFRGAGWVRFDPTTSIGAATQFDEPAAATPEGDDAAAPTPQPQTPEGANRPDTAAAPASAAEQTAPRTALVTLGVLLLLGGLPGLIRWLVHRSRSSRGRTNVDLLWRELEDVARDHGGAVSFADTPRGFADRLRTRPGLDSAALDALLRRVELSRFARDKPQEGSGLDDLAAVITSIRAGATRRERIRAILLPRSLAARTPADRARNRATMAT